MSDKQTGVIVLVGAAALALYALFLFAPVSDAGASAQEPQVWPGLIHSTLIGAKGEDEITAIALDRTGCMVLAGNTTSDDFPFTPGSLIRGQKSRKKAFVAKLNPEGNKLLFAACIGGSDYDKATAMALGQDGSIYVAGYTFSDDFPVTPGAFMTTRPGRGGGPLTAVPAAFIVRLNPEGTDLLYGSYLGGSGEDEAKALAVDPEGCAIVAGTTTSANFPTTLDVFGQKPGGKEDGFVSKLSPSGDVLIYSSYLGGLGEDRINAVACDADSNVWLTGRTTSTDFPVSGRGAIQKRYKGPHHTAFLARISPEGRKIHYSTLLGGNSINDANALALGPDGSVYVAGFTISADFPVSQGAYNTVCNGGGDAFVLRFDPIKEKIIYSTFIGGAQDDRATAIAVDADGRAVIAGITASLPPAQEEKPHWTSGKSAFISRISEDGRRLLYCTIFGGREIDEPAALVLDAQGRIHLGGLTTSPQWSGFPVTADLHPSKDEEGRQSAFAATLEPGAGLSFALRTSGDYPSFFMSYMGPLHFRLPVADREASSRMVAELFYNLEYGVPDTFRFDQPQYVAVEVSVGGKVAPGHSRQAVEDALADAHRQYLAVMGRERNIYVIRVKPQRGQYLLALQVQIVSGSNSVETVFSSEGKIESSFSKRRDVARMLLQPVLYRVLGPEQLEVAAANMRRMTADIGNQPTTLRQDALRAAAQTILLTLRDWHQSVEQEKWLSILDGQKKQGG